MVAMGALARLRWLLPAALVSACLFPSLGDLTGGDGGSSDGGGDVTIADTGGDTVAKDGGTNDGAPDARFCVTNAAHTFCEDFDDPTGFIPHWTSINVLPMATMVADSDASTSPPNSLLADDEGATGISAALTKHFGVTSHFTVSMEVRIDQRDDTCSYVHFVDVSLNPIPSGFGYTTYHDYLQTAAGGGKLVHFSALTDGGTATQSTPFSELFASFRHVVLDVDIPSLTMAVAVDGTLQASLPLPPVSNVTGVDLIIGSLSTNCPSAPIFKIRFDDVLVDVDAG
jgi:hypothetical protein